MLKTLTLILIPLFGAPPAGAAPSVHDETIAAVADTPDDSMEQTERRVLQGETPEQSLEAWMREQLATGWTWGPVKDPEAQEHPCLVPYDQLPPEQPRPTRPASSPSAREFLELAGRLNVAEPTFTVKTELATGWPRRDVEQRRLTPRGVPLHPSLTSADQR